MNTEALTTVRRKDLWVQVPVELTLPLEPYRAFHVLAYEINLSRSLRENLMFHSKLMLFLLYQLYPILGAY